jgi:hypothetical protein
MLSQIVVPQAWGFKLLIFENLRNRSCQKDGVHSYFRNDFMYVDST